ncbi:hypothetical protein [Yinghuangia seranimata]|uniref:hypothetical protein n=1 Tax=Yinghuangia seranimata TaxID=408067 RepID=UPI00248D256B|nr:hypothetical protein [Yinghuangia seranimata]MDI2125753.1 hypothetical protein [Yinghuangia seranimata]
MVVRVFRSTPRSFDASASGSPAVVTAPSESGAVTAVHRMLADADHPRPVRVVVQGTPEFSDAMRALAAA